MYNISFRQPPIPKETARIQKDYDLVKKLGQGCFGNVYEMREKSSNRHVAMKVICVDYYGYGWEEKEISSEVQTLASLDHDGIVRYYNSWTERLPRNWMDLFTRRLSVFVSKNAHEGSSMFFMAMELCSGGTLENYLERNASRDYEYMTVIFAQIVEAVDYIHVKGLIHGDLKPSNIFFTKEGNIKVGDFGLARSFKVSQASTSGIMRPGFSEMTAERTLWSALYSMPEMIFGAGYSNKIDIYALGFIFYRMLFSLERFNQLCSFGGVTEDSFPAEFKSRFPKEYQIIKSMMDKNPKGRPTADYILHYLTS